MGEPVRILIVGGYGTFGGRLVELLENEPRLALLVAGRSLEKAQAYCLSRKAAKAQLVAMKFDRAAGLSGQMSSIKPDVVVDASGPFQDYGEDRYGLIEACIAQGVNYLDLADGSDFVAGISQFDTAARKAGVFILSGVSSFPVLTAAVVRHLSADMAKVRSIRGGIAPSPYAGVGSNVIRAIASYSGQEISLKQAGKTKKVYPLTDSMRYTIAPPGRLPLRNTLFSLVDVPDLRVLADIWPEAESIWMGAGPVPEILHRALNAFAWLVRLGLVRSLLPLAGLMEFVMNHVRWGDHRGGMFVEVAGENKAGVAVKRSWHLLAEGRDGPLIPSMAIEAVVRKMLGGASIPPGARAAAGDVTLDDYYALFKPRRIHTGVREDEPRLSVPLYRSVLGTAWEDLPPEIRSMHDVETVTVAEGVAATRPGKNPLGNIARLMLGMPGSGEDVPVTVRFTVKDGVETWTRNFGGKSFSSRQYAGRGRSEHLLAERFGILTFYMALVPEDNMLRLVLRRWSVLGIPMPMFLCARSDSYEAVEDGKFVFNVKISHPLAGFIVHYRGWLLRKS